MREVNKTDLANTCIVYTANKYDFMTKYFSKVKLINCSTFVSENKTNKIEAAFITIPHLM